MVGRTPVAARQLASRARRRDKGPDLPVPDPDLGRQRDVLDAFFLAARGGDFEGPRSGAGSGRRLRTDWGGAPQPRS